MAYDFQYYRELGTDWEVIAWFKQLNELPALKELWFAIHREEFGGDACNQCDTETLEDWRGLSHLGFEIDYISH